MLKIKLENFLSQAGFEKNLLPYSALFYLPAVFCFGWFVAGVALNNAVSGLGAGLLMATGYWGWIYFQPRQQKKALIERFEKDLPFALLHASIELGLQTTFEKVLGNLSRNNYGLVSEAFGRALVEIKNGKSVPEALRGIGRQYQSLTIQRALSQFTSCYEHGTIEAANGLKKLGKELLAKQKIMAKEFSNQLVMIALMFIVASAIVPALFQAFVVVGSLIMDIGLDETQVLLIPAALFPLVDLGILIYIRKKTPLFLRETT